MSTSIENVETAALALGLDERILDDPRVLVAGGTRADAELGRLVGSILFKPLPNFVLNNDARRDQKHTALLIVASVDRIPVGNGPFRSSLPVVNQSL